MGEAIIKRGGGERGGWFTYLDEMGGNKGREGGLMFRYCVVYTLLYRICLFMWNKCWVKMKPF